MRALTRYACDWCSEEYKTKVEAAACEADPSKRAADLGDIVFNGAGCGWYDGDKGWISNPDVRLRGKCPKGDGNCFDTCCTYQFFYVVTAIDRAPRPLGWMEPRHPWRYHLFTRAMSGKQGYRGGYVYSIRKVVGAPPAHVITTSKDVLGTKWDDSL